MFKWVFSSLVVVACLFGIVLLVTELPEKEQTAEPSPSFTVPDAPVDMAAAEQIYKSNCLSCHGDQLQGRVGPELARVGSEMAKEQIYKQIAQGGGGMPKYENKLSEEQLIILTNWLASKQ
ncbi:c-type cytochrome [Cohnella thailandensis]|uniref:Cytochrome c n=1 Tax=Cohnella thailandensis TaxID=557557 RepID=A0A841T3W4_9BACL|nr:cytochrome c [Cohnella thailandensis]MBB6637048.1 cytochrome c [Cohnella thailandensis]MBP1973065.1 cytochrome c550 [Cohnella thailandensis]